MTRRLLAIALLITGLDAIPASAQDVVPVVSAKSPITTLSSSQVADINLGKTERFPDGSQAVTIDLQEGSPARERYYDKYTGKSPAQVKAHWSKLVFTGRGQPPRQVGSIAEARKAVAENPSAIGYLDASQVDSSLRVLAK